MWLLLRKTNKTKRKVSLEDNNYDDQRMGYRRKKNKRLIVLELNQLPCSTDRRGIQETLVYTTSLTETGYSALVFKTPSLQVIL